MARESLYRRSFHCDRDLQRVQNMFDLDQVLLERKASVDRRWPTSDGGLEAPRNSLDVPSGVVELRRQRSEPRCDDIPIGYELSRSLTARKSSEESSLKIADLDPKRQPATKAPPPHSEKPRPPSVVARLMGLDAMPHDTKTPESSSRVLVTHSSESSRRLLPQGFRPAQDGRIVSKQSRLSSAPSQRDFSIPESCGECDDEKVPYGELPFRDHPQGKQLEEFKKEFAARHALQGRNRQLLESNWRSDLPTMHGKTSEELSCARLCSGPDPLHESKEFLDALDFLHANKEFFVKVLKDPHSVFAKHLQRIVPAAKETIRQSDSRLKGSRSVTETRKGVPITKFSAKDSRRKQEIGQCKQKMHGRNISERQAFQASKLGPYEDVLACPARPARYISPASVKNVSSCAEIPTRIVVLKPNPGKLAAGKLSSSLNPLSRANVNCKMTGEGKENAKALFQEREILGAIKKEVRAAKEMARDQSKDGLKETAREIIKQVKEDMSRKLLKKASKALDSTSLMRSSSTGRRFSSQRVGFHGDLSGTSDEEGYCTPSRRTSKDTGKSYSSLPSSPRLSIHTEDAHRAFPFNEKKGAPTDASKRSSPRSTVLAQNPSNVDATSQRFMFSDSSAGMDVSQNHSFFNGKKKVNVQKRNSSFKDADFKGNSPKLLPRSLSVPTAATIENRFLVSDEKDGAPGGRSNNSVKTRSAESFPFKGRFSSLKDSFSLTKRKKACPPTQCSSVLEPAEITKPRQSLLHQSSVSKEPPLSLSDHPWQTACTTPQDDLQGKFGKDMDGYFEGQFSESSQEPMDVHHWASTDAIDGASENSMDKCEQPSPVSVLETPFYEESPSPVDVLGNVSTESRQEPALFQPDYKGRLLDLQDAMCTSSSRYASDGLSAEELLLASSSTDQLFESVSVYDTACPAGRENELAYIREILAFTGFARDGIIVVHAFSRHYSLNSSVFERLEQYYEKSQRKDSIRIEHKHSSLDASYRKLLFDVVDEMLSKKLRKLANQPQLKPATQFLRTGKHLLKQIWADIIDDSPVPLESQDEGLCDLASRDLEKATPWMHSQSDLEIVVIELEQLIYWSLIEEVVQM